MIVLILLFIESAQNKYLGSLANTSEKSWIMNNSEYLWVDNTSGIQSTLMSECWTACSKPGHHPFMPKKMQIIKAEQELKEWTRPEWEKTFKFFWRKKFSLTFWVSNFNIGLWIVSYFVYSIHSLSMPSMLKHSLFARFS